MRGMHLSGAIETLLVALSLSRVSYIQLRAQRSALINEDLELGEVVNLCTQPVA